MKTNITKWGNSLGVRIPKVFVQELGFKKDEEVEMMLKDHMVIIVKPKFTLEKFLKDINKDNIYAEIDTGDVLGKEIW